MRILLDECVPKRLKRHFSGHQVHHVSDMGWSGKKNGELLKLMVDSGFEVFLTVDQNIVFQQNVQTLAIAMVVLIARTNRMVDLLPLVPATLAALATIKPGDYVEIP